MTTNASSKLMPDCLDGMYLVQLDPGTGCYPWDLTPRDYLQFARAELVSTSTRACINAIGHAKRAIHAHIDFLLHNCGRCLRDSNFPTKLNLLRDLGIIAPEMLTRYNRLRNLLEHEYVAPQQSDAHELIDVAELFLEATRCYTRPLPSSLSLEDDDAQRVASITCFWDAPRIRIALTGPKSNPKGVWDIDKASNSAWLPWVSRILRLIQDAEDPYVRCQDSLAHGPP